MAIASGAVLVATAAWILWPNGDRPQPKNEPPRAREYVDFDACLLTDGRGVAGQPAAAVWMGMQEASGETRVRVSFLPVTGPDTKENALPVLASLGQRQCRMVFAVGPSQVGAVADAAPKFPHVRFYLIEGDSGGPNVTRLGGSVPDGIRASVKTAVVTQARAAGF